jgi:hypothetical protein
MTTLAFDLPSNNTNVSGIAVRLLVQISRKDFLSRNLDAPRVEIAELRHLLKYVYLWALRDLRARRCESACGHEAVIPREHRGGAPFPVPSNSGIGYQSIAQVAARSGSPSNSALQKGPPWYQSPTRSAGSAFCATRAAAAYSSARPVGR